MLYPIQNDARNKLDLSGIWDFQTDPEEIGESEAWYRGLPNPRAISVPGSWNDQFIDLENYLGLSWYWKKTYIPETWKNQKVFIRVGSANYFAKVFLNGVEIGAHEGGHLPFVFEITDHIRWNEENVIAISIENHLKPTRVPSGNMASALSMMTSFLNTTFDFFPFSGLHRQVVLFSLPKIHIDDVTVKTDIENTKGVVRITARLNLPETIEGKLVLTGENADIDLPLAFSDGVAETTIEVEDARFWSDKDPYLYQLSLWALDDHYALKIGIRTIAVENGNILLNGEPVELNGFGRHEDFYASGAGLNLPLLVKDYELMRWTGANSFRTSHNPYSEEDMQMADELGFLVIDETPAVSLQFDNEENVTIRKQICLQQLDELIDRDKNHPSVVMWCVANEPMPANIHMAGGRGDANKPDPKELMGKAFLDSLMDHARSLDDTRLVTLTLVLNGPHSWIENCDVLCLNRYWGWYVMGGHLDSALSHCEKEVDAIWQEFQKPIVFTEFGAEGIAGLHGLSTKMWSEEYQADLIERHLILAEQKPYICGMQIWNFADFAAVQSMMRVGGMNHKGVFTRTREPKMAARVLRKYWKKS